MQASQDSGAPEAWEDGSLGCEEEFVSVSTNVDEDTLDAAADLKPISIRRQQSLIDDYKRIAEINDIGYQPLIRQVLKRFADSEKKRLLRERAVELRDPEDNGDDEATNGKAARG
ncbi:hypothetical protein [Tamilnaduibacter salinus]|uniref:hypothetical protein n=1 Tax=Tamilnaduibacter salinus TaxID=1484056 RepID=UPI000E32523A|nr:hypothetical protein [Tamilnaduibacter salinus]